MALYATELDTVDLIAYVFHDYVTEIEKLLLHDTMHCDAICVVSIYNSY